MSIQDKVLGFEPTTYWTWVAPITTRPPELGRYFNLYLNWNQLMQIQKLWTQSDSFGQRESTKTCFSLFLSFFDHQSKLWYPRGLNFFETLSLSLSLSPSHSPTLADWASFQPIWPNFDESQGYNWNARHFTLMSTKSFKTWALKYNIGCI